ncbi:MAG: hypothetical protein A2X64_00640 [Ignavibacteria bacterium GWF2_33_9]|nr:MAG: hypothetical protein A2X64_00640 [Ignavibacteria bacterium GWF2_33_9]
MTKSIYKISIAVLAFLFFATSAYSLVPRKVLVEDFTGAWCGWCVLGNQAIEDMLAEYGSKFIPVAIHNGSASSDNLNSPLEPVLRGPLGVTGFPTGVINRKTNAHPSNWPSVVGGLINNMSPADVSLTYTLDKNAKTLTGTVSVTFSEDIAAPLAFNLYILEDNMNGTAQSNYLSGNASYKDHPYYSLPSKIYDYKHHNVLLDMAGGAWGTSGSLPFAGVKSGETYEHTFTVNLTTLGVPYQNLDNMWFVGLVQNVNSREIINAVSENKKMTYIARFANTQNYDIVTRNNKNPYDLTLTNENDVDITVDLSVNSKSDFPSDWSVTFPESQVVVPANSEITVTADVNVGSTAYYGQIKIDATVKSTSEYSGGSATANYGLLSDGIDYVMYHFSDGTDVPVKSALTSNSTVSGKIAYIPLDANTMSAFGSVDFKLVFIQESMASRNILIQSLDIINYCKVMMAGGTSILMTSDLAMYFVAGNNTNLNPVAAVKSFFNSDWGITGATQANPLTIATQNSQTGQITLYPLNCNGVAGEITEGFATILNQYDGTTHPFYTFWVDQLKVLDNTKASIILNYQQDGLTNTGAAAKIQTATNRNIYNGFSFDLIKDAGHRSTLLGNMITWLLGGSSVEFENNNANLSIYPNPVVSNSTVAFSVPDGIAQAEVYVIDANGNRVMNLNTQNVVAGQNNVSISASNLANGAYYLISNVNGQYSYTPFVIVK